MNAWNRKSSWCLSLTKWESQTTLLFLTRLFSYFISLRYSSLDSRLTPQGDDFEAGSRTEAFFRAIKLDYRDAQLLFDLLDQDQSGQADRRIDRRCNHQNQPDWSHQKYVQILKSLSGERLQVTVDEFIDGCAKLQGEATALETKALHLEVDRVLWGLWCETWCVLLLWNTESFDLSTKTS